MIPSKLFPLLLFLLSQSLQGNSSSDIFSSITAIDQAVSAGRHLASELQTYVTKEEARLAKMRLLIGRLENATRNCANNTHDEDGLFDASAQETIANPVSAFLTIFRLASNWSKELAVLLDVPISDSGQEETSVTAFNEFNSRRKLFLRLRWYADMLPGASDVDGALDAIIRLQQTYEIPASDIAEGRILPTSQSPRLTERQCMHLGLFAYELGDYPRAVEWFQLVLDRLNRVPLHQRNADDDGANPISHAMVYDHLSYALGRAGRYREALDVTNLLLNEGKTLINGALNKMFYEMELKRYKGNDPPPIQQDTSMEAGWETGDFDDLCRKADKPMHPDYRLSCRYTVPHPFFLIGPIKEEVMQVDPPIVLWHEFVTKNEAEMIIDLAKPKLKRALVRNPSSGVLEPAPYRVTKNVWLPDDLNNLTKSINSRIRMVTGLSIDHGEELQVANYGLGGYYAPHFDYARRFEVDAYERNHGNRIATFMVYLTPVQLGGATVFTKIGAIVKPVARSAVFWYNLLRSGDGDLRSRHGACPVLVGSKWVMNKWIRDSGQELKRPCLLEQEPFDPLDEYNDI
ncbi:unnamed protein product [Mesocestoides corti]|uniref:procollagen-proline 4-dioxygenase n=1 Tax=Mesocestoides corti TaxID=53468 RepID=A0A158QUB9_MESCO|nr:unnamed protein product [Mesocestoides corti]